MQTRLWLVFILAILVSNAHGFCGFYVAKAGANLYNKASQVVMVRNGNRTAITMFSDYRGKPKDFALVVPVPEVLKREQINVGNRALVKRVDAYSAPRLVEYFDPDPCRILLKEQLRAANIGSEGVKGGSAPSLGVKVAAKYTVGEYDIVILDAKQSDGLETWLRKNKYQIPKGAAKALKPYIKQDMKFFVAKVNLKKQAKLGFTYLRPIQFAFESEKFMLPIRLGMLNADGPQDMLVYTITRRGRVETTNYRTVKLPSGMDVPKFVKEKFPKFYLAMFENVHKREDRKAVFMEYAWNMGWCDPCAADPLTPEELRKLGVFWLDEGDATKKSKMIWPPGGGPVEAFITRLHVRYDKENFPEDLFFQETKDSSNFQGRYVVRHPWTKKDRGCAQATSYRATLAERREKEAQNLARLTGWAMEDIYKQMGAEPPLDRSPKWYQKIFK